MATSIPLTSYSDEAHDAYDYAPLTGSQHIRLFRLHPAENEDLPITGALQHVDLNDKPHFEALSYEWGSPELKREVRIIDSTSNPSRLRITSSLYNALRDLRRPDVARGDRVIWADALCINQSNIDERQKQVAIMGSIYRTASWVVTYIGPADKDTAMAIDFMRYLRPEVLWETDKSYDMVFSEPFPSRMDARCIAVRKLLTKGWAGRCWCAPEFLLNEHSLLMCGRFEMNWDLLPMIVQLVFNRSLPPSLLPGPTEDPLCLRECLAMLYQMRGTMYEDQEDHWEPTLAELLTAIYPMRASDPRDKVYALLGLACDANDLQVSIDYTRSVESLYATVAVKTIRTHQSLEILEWNIGFKSLQLPSWVPDWSTWRFGSNGMLARNRGAAGGFRPDIIAVDESKLEIVGCVLDTISFLSERVGPRFVGGSTIDSGTRHQLADVESELSTTEWLDEMVTVATHLLPYLGGPTAVELVWRTLTGNMMLNEEPADKYYTSYFEAYRAWNQELPLQTESSDRSDTKQEAMAREFRDNVRRRMRYRRLCTTEGKYIGAVPEESQIGDKLCVFEGAELLFVMRGANAMNSEFKLIGPAFVHGLMDGEAMLLPNYERQRIVLI